MINIPATSEEFAYKISNLFYKLSRPNPDPNDISKYYCAVQKHPKTDVFYLRMPEEDYFPIALDASDEKLIEALLPFTEMGLITDSDLETIKGAIAVNKGSETILQKFCPEYWKELAVPDSDFVVEDSL